MGTDMRDELIELLAKSNPIGVDEHTIHQIRSFFRARFNELLNGNARNHPLGFFYASESLGDGLNLRYHLWPSSWEMPTLEQGREDHDHTYRLNSIVVAGELRHRTFEAFDDPQGTHEILEVSYNSGDSVLSPSGRIVRVTCSGDERYVAGQCYQLRPGTIHRAVPVKLPMATIVVTTDDDNKRKPRVLARVGEIVTPTSFHRGQLNAEQIQLVGSELAKLLACVFSRLQYPPSRLLDSVVHRRSCPAVDSLPEIARTSCWPLDEIAKIPHSGHDRPLTIREPQIAPSHHRRTRAAGATIWRI
jgi:hypothetical protein